MSYSVTKIGGFGRPKLYREFLIDTIDDISSLPVTGISQGSIAYCVEENSRYIFTNNKEWEILSGGGGSGGGLPDVTSADNGKVLTVVEGDWVAAFAGSGTDAFVVTFTATIDDQTGEITGVSSNKTVSEIYSAVESGKFVVATIDVNRWGMSEIVWLYNDSGAFFENPLVDSSGVFQMCVEYGIDDRSGTDYFTYIFNEYPVSSDTGGGIFVINVSNNGSGMVMDKTFAEIQTAMRSMPVVANAGGLLGIVAHVQDNDRYKDVQVVVAGVTGNTVNWDALTFSTGSADGYPSMSG